MDVCINNEILENLILNFIFIVILWEYEFFLS
jgi:hypothetical protein